MRDSEKACFITIACLIPFVPVAIFYLFFEPLIQATFWSRVGFGVLFLSAGILSYLLLKTNPRVGHYNNALAMWDKNYRYVKEEAQ